MADLNSFSSFDPKKALESDLVPEGEYLIQVPPLKTMHSRTGDSSRLFGMAKIVGPMGIKQIGRQLPLSFTMEHHNETAVNIGHRQLAQLLKAAGKPDAKNTDEIAGSRVFAKVTIRPASEDGRFEAQNDVKGFRPDPASPVKAAQPAPAANFDPSTIPF